jgi:3-oxoacyl-[acyl-carrier protein] reductase
MIQELFDRAEEALGPVEIVVNNAALCERDTLVPADTAQASAREYAVGRFSAVSHDRHFAVNSRAPALIMAEFARRHAARGADWGRIINVSTDAAAGATDEVSYWASKHALESYSRSAALELGHLGITVNIVAPGPIQTGWMPPDLEANTAGSTPLGRVGRADDVADVIVFLASDQARWLTGQLLYVGGGHRMHQ